MWNPGDRDLRDNLEQPPEIMAMPGTILHRAESTGLAPRGEVDEDTRKMSMRMIQKTKSGAVCFSRCIRKIDTPKGFKLPTDKIKYEGVHEPEAWLDD
jgi:hypothetical protein